MNCLVVSTCQEKFSELEFVKPVTDILDSNKDNLRKDNIRYSVYHYKKADENILNNYDKIIICGTALKDSQYLNELGYFKWLKKINKPVLGICSGMQIIALAHGSKLIRDLQIGFVKVKSIKSNVLFSGSFNAYEIHNYNAELPENFLVLAKSKNRIVAIKHKEKNIFGLLFHPEVRNKDIIKNFIYY